MVSGVARVFRVSGVSTTAAVTTTVGPASMPVSRPVSGKAAATAMAMAMSRWAKAKEIEGIEPRRWWDAVDVRGSVAREWLRGITILAIVVWRRGCIAFCGWRRRPTAGTFAVIEPVLLVRRGAAVGVHRGDPVPEGARLVEVSDV